MERLLLQQLKEQPQNHALRLKLMDIYYETGRAQEFLKETQLLRVGFDFKGRAAEWNRVLSMGRMLGLQDEVFEQHVGGVIEFVDPAGAGAAQANAHRRIGEDEAHRAHFQALAAEVEGVIADPRFLPDLDLELIHMANRPSSLEDAKRLTSVSRGAQMYLKREDQSPPGIRLMISVVGQAMVAKRLNRPLLVTGTVTGFRGLVTASIAARLGLRAVVCIDKNDINRNALRVFQIKLLGADVMVVDKAKLPRNDVRFAAVDFWIERPGARFLVMGMDWGPPPYPMLMRECVAVIGRECRRQVRAFAKHSPDLLVARAGTTSDAVGFFEPFLAEETTRLMCVEAPQAVEREMLGNDLFDPTADGQVGAENLLAGIAHRGVEEPPSAREHGFLKASGRVEYVTPTADVSRKAIIDLSRLQGVVPAIEIAHVIGRAREEAARLKPEQAVVVMLSESADRDLLKISRVFSELT